MPSTVREWLPAGITGGGGSHQQPARSNQVAIRMGNPLASARDNANSAAQQMGLSPGTDSAFYACCPKLTYRQRIQGCIGCFFIGIVISFLGFVSWWMGQTPTFAILYTVGNVVSLCGTGYAPCVLHP